MERLDSYCSLILRLNLDVGAVHITSHGLEYR